MELAIKEIRKIRTQGNNVLIKLDRLPDELILKSGKKIFIDPTFEPEKNAAVTGSVVAVPAQLMYSPSKSNLIPWKTEMELEVNDKVVCYFMASINAFRPEHPRWIKDENGEFYILVKYEHVYIAKRIVNNLDNFKFEGEFKVAPTPEGSGKKKFAIWRNKIYFVDDDKNLIDIIPLNGYCIIEPVGNEEYEELEKKFSELGLRMPELMRRKHSIKYGIVKYIGKPNEEYWWNGKTVRDTDEGCDIKVGDKIVMRKSSDIPLEYEHHASLEGRKKFFRVQRRYIIAVLT